MVLNVIFHYHLPPPIGLFREGDQTCNITFFLWCSLPSLWPFVFLKCWCKASSAFVVSWEWYLRCLSVCCVLLKSTAAMSKPLGWFLRHGFHLLAAAQWQTLSLFHLLCGCSVHALSKVKPYLSARGPWVAQHYPSVPLRGVSPFCLLVLSHFTVDENVLSHGVLRPHPGACLILHACRRRWGWRRVKKREDGNETSPPKGKEILVYKIYLSFTRYWKSIFGLAQTEPYANIPHFLRVFNTNLFSNCMTRICFLLTPEKKTQKVTGLRITPLFINSSLSLFVKKQLVFLLHVANYFSIYAQN